MRCLLIPVVADLVKPSHARYEHVCALLVWISDDNTWASQGIRCCTTQDENVEAVVTGVRINLNTTSRSKSAAPHRNTEQVFELNMMGKVRFHHNIQAGIQMHTKRPS